MTPANWTPKPPPADLSSDVRCGGPRCRRAAVWAVRLACGHSVTSCDACRHVADGVLEALPNGMDCRICATPIVPPLDWREL